MKKILMGLMMLSAITFAETKIYKDYTYNQEINTKWGYQKTDITNMYENNETGITFGVFEEKLKFVRADLTNFELKTEIEEVLKLGFRLKTIDYSNKFGTKNIENVGILMESIEDDMKRSALFDVLVTATLKFESVLDNMIIVFDYKRGIDRNTETCKICEELNGKTAAEFKLLQIYYTALEKDD